MNIIINGALGHMGREVFRLANEGCRNAAPVCLADINFTEKDIFENSAENRSGNFKSAPSMVRVLSDYSGTADVIVDFSHHSATPDILDYAIKNNIAVVIATTGHTPEEMELIKKASEKIAVFHSANMSLGVALLAELATKVAVTMPDADIEIVETHHNRKLDAPSGTALMLARAMENARKNAGIEAFITSGRDGMCKRKVGEIGISAVRRGAILGIHEIIFSTDAQSITLKHEAHDRALFAEGGLAAAEFICGKPAGLYNMNNIF